MRYANRLSVITAAIAAGAAVALLLLIGGSPQATTHASQPSTPPDCHVADEPTGDGPAAPSDLTAEWSPAFYGGGFLLDAFDVVNWTDNADSETCFVVEMRPSGGSYEVIAFLGPNASSLTAISGPGTRTYRVYAADSDSRSAYSNDGTINAVYNPPTPTPTPSPSSTPTPSAVTPTPTLSAMPDPQPTPAALPKTGGLLAGAK